MLMLIAASYFYSVCSLVVHSIEKWMCVASHNMLIHLEEEKKKEQEIETIKKV